MWVGVILSTMMFCEGHSMAESMIIYEEALQIARSEVSKSRHEMIILTDDVLEFEFGWVFLYQPKRFYETQDPKYAVPGNGPLIVHRDGTVKILSSVRSVEEEAKSYLQSWKARQ